MDYYISSTHDTASNMAVEAYLFEECLDLDNIFYLWINQPSIIIGKHQNAYAEVNADYVREHGIGVHRRISGGGAVYHDLNNLNYTLISNDTELGAFDFKKFSQPVIRALAAMGLHAECTGRNDISLDGRKICGNAQARKGTRVLHHGCILYDVDLSVLADSLKVDPEKIASKSVKSVRARVVNIASELQNPMGVDDFEKRVFQEVKNDNPDMKEISFSSEECQRIKEIRSQRFANPDWNWGKSADFDIVRKLRFPAGGLEAQVNVEDHRIREIRFHGDFFSSREISELEEALLGCSYQYDAVLARIREQSGSPFFAGISPEEAASVITAI